MGLNKPITVGGGLTAAEVQSIIDAQTTAINGKVDAQTDALKADLPSSISGGASVSEIKAALDEKLPQYQNGAVVKSRQIAIANADDSKTLQSNIAKYGKDVLGLGNNINYADSVYGTYGVFIAPNIHTPELERQLINGACGTLVLSPVDKSKSLIHSESNGFYENRDFDNGVLERGFSVTKLNDYDEYYKFSVANEKIMCLEFN